MGKFADMCILQRYRRTSEPFEENNYAPYSGMESAISINRQQDGRHIVCADLWKDGNVVAEFEIFYCPMREEVGKRMKKQEMTENEEARVIRKAWRKSLRADR